MMEKPEDYLKEDADNDSVVDNVMSVKWWSEPGIIKLYCLIPILFLSATSNGYDGSLLNGLQTMDPWQNYFNHPSGSTLGLFTAIVQIGSVVGSLMSSYLADYLGRKLSTALGSFIIVIATIIQVVPSVNKGMFIGGRFLLGFGANISSGAAPLLVTELAHPSSRGKITTVYNTCWCVGAIIAAWTVYGTIHYKTNASWKIPVGIQAAMPFIQLCTVWFVPESPRWLVSKGKRDKAMKILTKYHASGRENDSFVHWEMAEIESALEQEKAHKNHSWFAFLQTPGNRKRIFIITLTSFYSQCSGNGLVSYYIHDILSSVGVSDSSKQSIINGGLQIWTFLTALFFSAFLVDKLGRRLLFMIAGIGMLITFTIWTACSAVYAQNGNKGCGRAVIAMIFLFYGVAGFAWPGLTVAYPAEILPYNIRAKGLAYGNLITSLASVFNQYVNPIGLDNIHWKFYFVYIAILVVECITIYIFFVETKGPTLEEVSQLFDEPGWIYISKKKRAARSEANVSSSKAPSLNNLDVNATVTHDEEADL